ncbi:GNAT family N-acetyltransferase [Streptomyces kaniharaensis]|uniref:GNAT family N-acetyltransferase n=2 Tax=Streptomyces kaniharaensis TaxID=212423 RepID=A0A6N7KZK5_9ACTN|nr:GNAT family N-acetyltransferase [Streptomyces kaniharaensis]
MGQREQPRLRLADGSVLRPWRVSDVGALVAASEDADIRHWNRLGRLSPEEARARIGRWGTYWRDESAAIWAVAPADTDEAQGLIGLGDVSLADGTAEFLYWLLPAARRRGLAAAALAEVTRWALGELGLHRLRLTHSTANAASCRVAERAGFALEGTMRSALLHADGWHDEHLHARVRSEA